MKSNKRGYNEATRKEMQMRAKAFLRKADELNELVSAYLDGSNEPEAGKAFNKVLALNAAFNEVYCAYWGEPSLSANLDYELAESVLQ